MKFLILAVGKLRQSWLKQGCQEYLKRLCPKVSSIEIIEVKDTSFFIKRIPPRYLTWVLDEKGQLLSSVELAEKINQTQLSGCAGITWCIGGADGIPAEALPQGHTKISLSSLTFPHQLVRLLLLEQLYRAYSIIGGEPYHRE